MKKRLIVDPSIIILIAILFHQGCEKVYEVDENDQTPKIENGHETGTVIDVDGNVYKTVKIGNQLWMAENLRATRYNNGDSISYVPDATQWGYLTKGAYCYYDNNENNKSTYGNLYNFYAVVDSRNLCPSCWHVPSDDDWNELVKFVGGDAVAAIKLKESGTENWLCNEYVNALGTDEYGFKALPGGVLLSFSNEFTVLGSNTFFWTSTEDAENIWYRLIHCQFPEVQRFDIQTMTHGYSVRCIMD
jgi:uncharacterized protein (TIGR02145 family)